MATPIKDLQVDESRGYIILVVQSVFLAVALPLMVLRLYVRKFIVPELGWDDLFMVVATLLAIVFFAFSIVAVHNGLGRHIFYLSITQIEQAGKYLTFCPPVLLVENACSRISIALFLKRVLVVEKRWSITLISFIVFMVVNHAALLVQQLLSCRPYEAAWTAGEQDKCWPSEVEYAMGIYAGALSAACDFFLAALPVIFLWDIKISRKRKFGICCLMGFGLITAAFDIARTAGAMLAPQDPTWDNVNVFLWASIEELFLIIGGTIPTVKPIIRARRGHTYIPDFEAKSGDQPLKGTRET